MSKLTYFVKMTKAFIKGDDAEVIALQNEKLATFAINQKISILAFDIEHKKIEIGKLDEKVVIACCPTTKIDSAEDYSTSIDRAITTKIQAEKELANLEKNKVAYEGLLKSLSELVAE